MSVGVLAILQNMFHRILMMKGSPDGCMRIFRSSQKNGNWQYPKIRKNSSIILKKLLNRPDIEFVVNACDAGREGELIFKHVYDLSGSKKPVKRLWISSLESSSILEGMEHLKAGETYHNLAEAADLPGTGRLACRYECDKSLHNKIF